MKRVLIFWLFVLIGISARSQYKMTAEQYVEKYKHIAIEKMNTYRIPASITLSQAILESGWGGSELALKANNHFGIKCGNSWTGPRVLHDDDAKDDCFRKYASVEESYRDHSIFLTERKRYADLFKLKLTDYKGWAHGLKAAGYATNPRYAEILIDLIEKYNLDRFDKPQPTENLKKPFKAEGNSHKPMIRTGLIWGNTNGVRYVVARQGDTYYSISRAMKIPVKRLLRFNDTDRSTLFDGGEKVYIKAKKSSNRLQNYHIARAGETSHSISQEFGLKENSLKNMNPKLRRNPVNEGQKIRLN